MSITAVHPDSNFIRVEMEIPEDSGLQKVLACIPFLGFSFGRNNQATLAGRLFEDRNLTMGQQAKLLSVKNHYKVAEVVNMTATLILGVLVTLLIPAGTAMMALRVGCCCILSCAIGLTLSAWENNRWTIDTLERNTPGTYPIC